MVPIAVKMAKHKCCMMLGTDHYTTLDQDLQKSQETSQKNIDGVWSHLDHCTTFTL